MAESRGVPPSVSVVIPCHNDQSGLDRALTALQAQTDPDFEVIVVDDGSDPPVRVIDDARVRLFRHEETSGPAVARNTGLAEARGSIVAFCDSDDSYMPHRIKRIKHLHMSAAVAVVGQSDGRHPEAFKPVPNLLAAALDRGVPHLGATSVRRHLCPRFDARFLACQDIEWWIRLIVTQGSFASTEEVGYLVWPSSRPRLLNSPTARLDLSYALLEAHSEFFDARPAARAFRWFRIAVYERREGNYGLAGSALYESLRAQPTRTVLREALRLAVATQRHRVPNPVGTDRLAPLSTLRGRRFAPGRRGGRESRQALQDAVSTDPARASPRLPAAVQRRARRVQAALTGRAPLASRRAWAPLAIPSHKAEATAPYTDGPLEMALLARCLRPGMTCVDIGADLDLYFLMFARRAGPTGRVLLLPPDATSAGRLDSLITANGIEDRCIVVPGVVRSSIGDSEDRARAEVGRDFPLWGPLIDGVKLAETHLMRINLPGAEQVIVHSVLKSDCRPEVLMFTRRGHQSATEDAEVLIRSLLPEYLLYRVSYREGGLMPFKGPAILSTQDPGNILALRRDLADTILSRMLFRPPPLV